MSTLTAARLASLPLLTSSVTLVERPSIAGAEGVKKAPEAGGWDPYEVWRTRVLLPRLKDKSAAEDPSTITTPSASLQHDL
jgi:hypothetical protein